jgi:FKBP-type peptidyl-prolyl cis-trans isomerase
MPRDVSGDGGVLLETTIPGNGVKPAPGQIVFVQYVGKLSDGTVFDATRDKPHRREIGFYFALGEGAVIQGWDVGFLHMTVGECATLTLRYDYGYGEDGMPQSRIPPRATLVFDVELMAARTMTTEELDEVDAEVERLRG